MKIILILLSSAFVVTGCNAFLSYFNQADPVLQNLGVDVKDSQLNIRLDIGTVEGIGANGTPKIGGNRLGIDGLIVQLLPFKEERKHPKMPGSDGPHPQLSSGIKSLAIVQEGSFVDHTGKKCAKLLNGGWEMVWRKGARAGAFICGFTVPGEIKRNLATVPRGQLYCTFPVWSSESLQDLRERKEKAEEKAVEAMDRLKEHTKQMEQTGNLLMKALHFRQACKAHEDIDYSGFAAYKSMPLERDMIRVNSLNICSLGTVWTKTKGGSFFGGKQILLGSASLQSLAEVSA